MIGNVSLLTDCLKTISFINTEEGDLVTLFCINKSVVGFGSGVNIKVTSPLFI